MSDNKLLRQILEGNFMDAMAEAEAQNIEDVKANRVRPETVVVPPSVPSLEGKKLKVYWKDPEAVSNAVSEFIDSMLKKVKNGNLVREELEEAVYAAVGKADIGEYFGVALDLTSGKVSLLKV